MSDEPDTIELPRYRCHKEVHAAKIAVIHGQRLGTSTQQLELELEGGGSVHVLADWVKKHSPIVGGYYVVYKDGYESWSPADAFEDGYTPIVDHGGVPPSNELTDRLLYAADNAPHMPEHLRVLLREACGRIRSYEVEKFTTRGGGNG